MATGGFKPNATTDFLEEWKAKREKMRAKMLGDIAAATGAPMGATGAPLGASNGSRGETRNPAAAAAAAAGPELTNNGNPDRGAPAGNCLSPNHPVARSSSSASALKRPEEETQHPAHPAPAAAAAAASTPGSNLKKSPPQPEKVQCVSPESPSPAAAAGNDSDKESPSPGKESPSPGKGKEKKSAGPSARKGKGQIEKRKLREKRRSTGVVSIPSNESLDELDDDDGGEKERKKEEELVQANTFQNEAMIADPGTGHLMETPRSGSGRHKGSAGSEEEVGGNGRHRQNRHGRDGGAAPASGGLERRIEELEKELARQLKAHQDKDDLIGKLKEEIDLLNRDLDDIEDENEQLKQENKTLLKVVGQLTR